VTRVAVYREAHRGREPDDFAFTADGELLGLPFVCSTLERRKACGCDRSFVGLTSASYCTTAVVEEWDRDAVVSALRASELRGGGPDGRDAFDADFWSLSEALPPAGRVIRVRNTPGRFEVFERPRPRARDRRRR
jgi:hypothetical protein